MCREKNECSELGRNPDNWDQECPLRPPAWIDHEINIFAEALDMFIQRDREACLQLLATIRDNEITEWYIEHGQMSGRHRKNALGLPKPDLISEDLRDPLRSPQKYQEAVFNRDNYHCRYCGSRLVSQKLMRSFSKVLNSDRFKKGPTNLTTHGIIHATWPVADHVVPWNMGGRTILDNCVTSCGACNYGKDGYTCEQIGISDPFERPPVIDGWDGLVSRITDVHEIEAGVAGISPRI